MNASESGTILALYPGLARALDAANLLLTRLDRLRIAEEKHVVQGGSKKAYDRAVGEEKVAEAALRKALTDWRNPACESDPSSSHLVPVS